MKQIGMFMRWSIGRRCGQVVKKEKGRNKVVDVARGGVRRGATREYQESATHQLPTEYSCNEGVKLPFFLVYSAMNNHWNGRESKTRDHRWPYHTSIEDVPAGGVQKELADQEVSTRRTPPQK